MMAIILMKTLIKKMFKYLDLKALKRLPDTSGVYFVFSGGELLYIGGTRNLRSRMTDHKRFLDFRSYGVDGLCYLEAGDWVTLERQYQVKLTPKLNKELFLGSKRYKSPKIGYFRLINGQPQKIKTEF